MTLEQTKKVGVRIVQGVRENKEPIESARGEKAKT